jgi:HPP family
VGHAVAVTTGVGLTKLFMLHPDYNSIKWIVGPLICGVASALMTLTNTVHPPGGATALLAAVDPTVIAMGWWFVPTILLGSLLMMSVALLVNNIQRQYPVFWWTGKETGRRKEGDIESHLTSRRLSRKLSTRFSQRRRYSDASALLQLRDLIAITEEIVALPEGFTLAADEARVLQSLQRRLALWTKLDGAVGVAVSSSEQTLENVPLEMTRIPNWHSASIQDPDVATVRGGSGAFDETAIDWFRHSFVQNVGRDGA